MTLHVAHVWDEYLFNSFVEVHPLFRKHGLDVDSITITRTLRDNGCAPDDTVYAQRRAGVDEMLNTGLLRRALGYLERRYWTGSFVRFAKNVMAERKTELVHYHFGFTAAQYPRVADDRPFLVTFYGSDVSLALQSRDWIRRYRRVLPKARALLVLCEEAKQRLAGLGCDPARIEIWNLPAGVEKYPYREVPASAAPPRMLMTARFVEKKGHELALDALALLRKDGVPFSITFLGYGSGKAALERGIEARSLGDCARVLDTSARGDFAALHYDVIKQHDLFLLPSIRASTGDDEGGPSLTMVCAQAAGLPVVCTRFPGAEITMRDGVTGRYVADSTPEAIAYELRGMFRDRHLWSGMGRAGSELANANFGERQQMARLLEIYGRCLR